MFILDSWFAFSRKKVSMMLFMNAREVEWCGEVKRGLEVVWRDSKWRNFGFYSLKFPLSYLDFQ
jgi:hypothetical protein